MIVLDASLLIAQFEARDEHHEAARRLLGEWERSPLAASTVTVAEVLVTHAGAGRIEHGVALLDDLDVLEIPFGGDASRRLAQLRATTRLKLPDCCVLLAAQDAGAGGVASFDDRLAKAAVRLGFAALPER